MTVYGNSMELVDVYDFIENDLSYKTNLTTFCKEYFDVKDISVLDSNHYFGTSWIDVLSNDLNEECSMLVVDFDSSWTPPKKFADILANHFNVFVKLEYSEPMNNIGGIYETGGVYKNKDIEMTYYEYWYVEKQDPTVLNYLLEICDEAEEVDRFIKELSFEIDKQHIESIKTRLKLLKDSVEDN
jgi:hypothetical protein